MKRMYFKLEKKINLRMHTAEYASAFLILCIRMDDSLGLEVIFS